MTAPGSVLDKHNFDSQPRGLPVAWACATRNRRAKRPLPTPGAAEGGPAAAGDPPPSIVLRRFVEGSSDSGDRLCRYCKSRISAGRTHPNPTQGNHCETPSCEVRSDSVRSAPTSTRAKAGFKREAA